MRRGTLQLRVNGHDEEPKTVELGKSRRETLERPNAENETRYPRAAGGG